MLTDHQWSVLRDIITLAILALTVWGVIYGPVRAVVVQRDADEEREARRRKFGILHNLMKTRSWTLHVDHVMALNLVQLEFDGHDEVVAAFRRYREHLNMTAPTDPAANLEFEDERRDRFYTLIKAIADLLGYKFDKAYLRRLAYTPQGWHNELGAQDRQRRLMIEVLEGRRPIPMTPFHISAVNSKFPKPPQTIEQPPAEGHES